MTFPVTSATPILSSDFNELRAQVQEIMGQNKDGWGLSIINSEPKSSKNQAKVKDWVSLRADLDWITQHYSGSSATILSVTSSTAISADITNQYSNLTQLVNANRYVCAENQYYIDPVTGASVNYNGASSVRTLPWGLLNSGQNVDQIEHRVRLGFPDRDTTRYFFNLGSYLTYSPYHLNNGLGGVDNKWSTFINSVRSTQDTTPIKYNRTVYNGQTPGSTTTMVTYTSDTLAISVGVYKFPNEYQFEFVIKYSDTDSSVLTVAPDVGQWVVFV